MTVDDPVSDPSRHHTIRIRRDTRRRTIAVAEVQKMSPNMIRVRFKGDELRDFESAAPDDHVKLFVPDPASEGGVAKRDYTPRHFDTAAGDLVIDFAVHEAGPATRWAVAAKPGDTLSVGGPRGSGIVTDDFDWYLLIGDETAIPAIARRVEELRHGVSVTVVIAVELPEDQVGLPARDGLTVVWSPRAGAAKADADRLIDSIPALADGDGYVWIAAEAQVARALRSHVVDVLGQPKAWTKASGYWTVGRADAHETFSD